MGRFGLFSTFLIFAAFSKIIDAKDIDALVGSAVDLPCLVDTHQCGELHSVKWYRDTHRIYVYSQFGTISRPEGNATKRMSVEYAPNNTKALLKINKVELQDEASYKCEITYLEVRENCDVVQIIKLQTMVQPESARIFSTMGDPNQASITNSTFGPYDESTEIELVCEANGGKPEPQVRWYNGTHEIRAAYNSITDDEGLSTGTAKLNIVLNKGDLKARYECRVTSLALKDPLVSWITMDVHTKPHAMELKHQDDVVQGNTIQLVCDVFGANPPASIKWFNNTNIITNESFIEVIPEAMPILTEVTENPDGTFTTKSHLQFKATRWDNERQFKCYAENSVTIAQKDLSFTKPVLLHVKYAPVVSVFPENITRNETNPQNALIKCQFVANPMTMTGVYWTKDGKNLTLIPGKHEGGTKKSTSLTIKNVSRDDMGEYTCVCMNAVGASESENSAYLDVQYPPSVEVVMEPATPVKSLDELNVTAVCSVVDGNPKSLSKVRWFLGDDLLKELPECNYTSEDSNGGLYCNVDPNVLSLVTVDQSFAGNYTCQGMNVVGWGLESHPTELVVYYPPSPAKLTYAPSKVIKGGQIELSCSVDHPGRPEKLNYVWKRGIHKMSGETSSTLTIKPVKLDTRNNFTCQAVNDGGVSESASVFVNVSAPPSFIIPLTYQHVKSLQPNMSLTCRVECWPLCFISWFKGSEQIDTRNNPLYDIKTTIHDSNAKTGDFESIESTLVWNVDAWPIHPFAKGTPTSTYGCISSSNGVGHGVNGSVQVEVQYRPENVTVSQLVISEVEHKIPKTEVNCTAKGIPDAKYRWIRNSTRDIISKSATLKFVVPVLRNESGVYICEAHNIHGSAETSLELNVEYTPECFIKQVIHEEKPALLCTVDANPEVVSFSWSFQGANGTWEETFNTQHDGIRDYLLLESGSDTVKTYRCVANNSAGMGHFCKKDVTGVAGPWWHIFGSDSILILVAIIAGIILCALFVCIIIIIIICVCKRRRARNKLPNQSTIPDRGRLGGPNNDGSTDPLTNSEKGVYENLPFHGMQTPPNKPYRPEFSDLDYADVDYRSYGPINYKAASLNAMARKNKKEDKEYDDLL